MLFVFFSKAFQNYKIEVRFLTKITKYVAHIMIMFLKNLNSKHA